MIRLFVYGTLMRGQSQDGLLSAFSCLPAHTRGHLYLVPAGYPALVPDPAGQRIMGELFRVERPGVLRVLDLYEGVAEKLYRRVQVDVEVGSDTQRAFAYVMTADQVRRRKLRRLDGTDWRKVRRQGRL